MMTMLGTFTKQPAEVLDFDLDADEWLPTDDFVITAVTVADAGLDIDSTLIFDGDRKVKVWVSGGTTGTTYKVQVTMTTDDGRVKESEFRVKVKEV